MKDLKATASAQTTTMWHALRPLFPGIALAVVIGLAALFLSEHYGPPVMLMALLIGMVFNPLAEESASAPGIEFASKGLLRAGVALLGVRVSMSDIASLGVWGFGTIAGLLVATILLGILMSRRDWQLGLLAGGAVGICGASAALAISSCLPRGQAMQKETLFTVVAVTAMSTLAMIIYPIVLVRLGLNESEIAFVLGASIHDVAQVVGAGLTISTETAELATLVKMVRVSLLPVVLFVLILVSSTMNTTGTRQKITLPGFLIVFFVLAVLANTGLMPEAVADGAVTVSKSFLIVAISALGAKTSLRSLATAGSQNMIRIGILTLMLFTASAISAHFLTGLS